jgi:ubiquinone/menaquinone biosynthesis C-methylase UbiE
MNKTNIGQLPRNAAEIYEDFLVPALFQQWTSHVADAANIQPGQRVLDVACGTGVLTRAVAERVGSGSIVGVDVNEGMLEVAKRKAPEISWHQGRAETLPFDDNSFDAVVSQFGLTVFQDRLAALHEMLRVLKPGGSMAVAVWNALEQLPGYTAFINLLQELFGTKVADALRTPFALGDTQTLRSLFIEAGIADAKIVTQAGTARFPSLESWVYTEAKGWILGALLDNAQYELLLKEAKHVLQKFVMTDGTVVFSASAHIVCCHK